jgi:glycosyltransferase involved in cell wall biosynthesis
MGKRYKTLTITGLGNTSKKNLPFVGHYQKGLEDFRFANKNADGYFFLSPNLCMQKESVPVLTVSHGVMIDGKQPNQIKTPSQVLNALDMYKKWIRNCTHCISVDTNTIKLLQVYDYKNSNKFTYIPNYVDLNKFKEVKKEDNGMFSVLFPRRLQWCRGYTYMMKASDVLLEKYKDIEIIFCGKGNKAEEDEFNEWKKTKDNRVKYMWYEMDDMPLAYKLADISCVPTVRAEGTSLSVVEAMACGVPNIVTCVGGLTDLVFKNVNGLVIMPENVNQIVESVEYLYHNRDELEIMKKNGLEIIKSFDKSIWEKRVLSIVSEVFYEN